MIKRDHSLASALLRLDRELRLLEDRRADLSAVGDVAAATRAAESDATATFYGRSWTTREVLAILQEERRTRGTPPRLVVTLPSSLPSTERTYDAVQKLIDSAQRQILIFGYIVGREMEAMIAKALERDHVEVHLVLDVSQNADIKLQRHDRLFVYRPTDGQLMHIKAIAIDAGGTKGESLVGSANFSTSALGKSGPSDKHNWEMGVRLGRQSASGIWDVFQSLKEARWLETHELKP